MLLDRTDSELATEAEHSIHHRADPYFDQLPVPGIVFDSRDRILDWNHAAAVLYGIEAQYAIGESILIYISHDALDTFARACEAVRRSGSWTGVLSAVTALGEPLTVEARWVAFGQDAILAVHEDRSAIRRFRERELRSARWQAVRRVAWAAAVDLASEHPHGPSAIAIEHLHRFAGDPDPAGEIVFHGNGDLVLVAGMGKLLQELIAALLTAAGYRVLGGSDPFDAIQISRGPELLRTAVVGGGLIDESYVREIRQRRPLLPIIRLGTQYVDQFPEDELHRCLRLPLEPKELVAAVAESVAADRMNDVNAMMNDR